MIFVLEESKLKMFPSLRLAESTPVIVTMLLFKADIVVGLTLLSPATRAFINADLAASLKLDESTFCKV